MELFSYFKSIIEQDRCAVVICNRTHQIIYMNPAAVARYQDRGGAELIGKSLLDCHNTHSQKQIRRVVSWFGEKKENNIVHTFYNKKENKDVYMVALRDGAGELIGYYEKHEYRTVDAEEFYGF